ncbi:piggyBac transposable element-derived protein 2-like, partial [Calliphora vicina]|uniref:piggyBac transposable element-derived protein 2-like n=1 Tax=Calliphora vicina TaxID=7373 RepID=UPI00325BB968
GQKSFKGLQEAVDSILADSEDEDIDMVIIPPNPSELTDEEEGVEDDMISSALPQDIPGTIDVFVNRRNIDNDVSDDSDDEPLESKRTRLTFATQKNPIWDKCHPPQSPASQQNTEVYDRVNQIREELKNRIPVQIFETLFDEKIIDLIISNSTNYAKQNNRHEFHLNDSDLKKFLGVLILSGYNKLPREPMYWSLDEDIGKEIVAKALSRHRFRDIKRNIHLVDDNLASTTTDKMFKFCSNTRKNTTILS